MGSDCHDWREYPYHDKKEKNLSFQHSYASILPTFKGLLMAVTSPETRINRPDNENDTFISSFSIGGVEVPLVNGINAIIGENGSGKSTLLKCIAGRRLKKQYENDIKENNSVVGTTISQAKIYFVEQGDIVKKFDEKKLFPNELYESVNVNEFVTAYRQYGNKIHEYIHHNIEAKDSLSKLSGMKIKYDPISETRNHFINIKCPEKFDQIENPHKAPDDTISRIVSQIEELFKNEYYKPYENELKKALEILSKIAGSIHKKNELTVTETQVKNAIVATLKEYTSRIEAGASTQERKKRSADAKKQKLIDVLINTINLNTIKKPFPSCPKPMSGETRVMRNGFSFNEQTNYHERELQSEFLRTVFKNSYASEDAISMIDSIEDYVDAVRGCTDDSDVEELYQRNMDSFISDMCDIRRFIVDGSQSSLGNTLGEMSLAYFKYITDQNNEKCIYVLDQPEDHISNRNISSKLIAYFNSIRYKKQIIIVTHNPLLVVNQDVDQVVFLSKDENKISVISGCLEQEDDNGINMLDIIANNMDGGKASIEKRLRVYGKENSS